MARILVVEPDRRICRFIAGILADFGHEVEECNSAHYARRRLARERFDVLATDLVLAENKVDNLLSLAARLTVVTLCGHRCRPGAEAATRGKRPQHKPFRFADLSVLLAAIDETDQAALHAA
jgi:DNA-binding NtrC family response regulator